MLDIRKNSQIARPSAENASKSQTSITVTQEVYPHTKDFGVGVYKGSLAGKQGHAGLLEFICFIIDDEEYALEINEATEAIKMREMTEVPHAPSFIAGIISLRGEIIPAMSLQKRLGLEDVNLTSEARIIIACYAGAKLGLIVDRITGVLKARPAEIEPAPPIQGDINVEFIRGVVHHSGRLVILLNMPKLFDMENAPARSEGGAVRGLE